MADEPIADVVARVLADTSGFVQTRIDAVTLAQEVARLTELMETLASSLHHAPWCHGKFVKPEGFHGEVMVGCDCGCDKARLAWAEHTGAPVQRVELPGG